MKKESLAALFFLMRFLLCQNLLQVHEAGQGVNLGQLGLTLNEGQSVVE